MSDRDTDASYPLYPHGYSVRVHLHGSATETSAALMALGWPDGRRWRETTSRGAKRYTRVGSVYLTGRAPRNENKSMAKLNRAWGTRLYHVGFTFGDDDDLFLDLVGVRRRDVCHVVEHLLRHEPDDYDIAYYRQLEVYAVLASPDAFRMSQLLNGERHRGKGSLWKKDFLLRDHPVPMTVRKSAKVTGFLTMYRIMGGATSAWKAELLVRRRANQGGGLLEADERVLERTLRAILSEAGVQGIAKPHLWEPTTPGAVRGEAPGLKRLRTYEYRGKAPTEARRSSLHTPLEIRLVSNASRDEHIGQDFSQAGVSSPHSSSTAPQTRSVPLFSSSSASPNAASIHDVLELAFGTIENPDVFNYFSEIEDVTEQPTGLLPSVQSVASAPGRPLLSQHQGQHLVRSVASSPPRPRRPLLSDFTGVRSLEVVAEPVESAWVQSLCDELAALPDGTLSEVILDANHPPTPVAQALVSRLGAAVMYVGPTDEIPVPLAKLMACNANDEDAADLVLVVDPFVPFRMLDSWVEELRPALEASGGRVFFVTADRRRRHYKVPVRRDFGSTVHALWHYANQRYRVDVDGDHEVIAVDVIKDERHGHSGRRLWGLPALEVPLGVYLDLAL